jgi:hypothetical protein
MDRNALLRIIASEGGGLECLLTAAAVPPWEERNVITASLIAPGGFVGDIGPGVRPLRRRLPQPPKYTPVDVITSTADAIEANFNKRIVSSFSEPFDAAEVQWNSGMYMPYRGACGSTISRARRVFQSDSSPELKPRPADRENNGWPNRCSSPSFPELFRRSGLSYRLFSYRTAHVTYGLERRQ